MQCFLIDQEIFYGENRYVEPFIKNVFEYYVKEDLDKYKLSSKEGVVLEVQKEEAKPDISDDDSKFNLLFFTMHLHSLLLRPFQRVTKAKKKGLITV